MAFAAVILGSVFGLVSFSAAWLHYGYSFSSSFGIYLLTSVVFAVVIAVLKLLLCDTYANASEGDDLSEA